MRMYSATAVVVTVQLLLVLAISKNKNTNTLVDAAYTGVNNGKFFSTVSIGGVQSGPDADGGTFVSSAKYSAIDNSVIMTGSTWGRWFESSSQRSNEEYDQFGNHIDSSQVSAVNGCYLATASLPGGDASTFVESAIDNNAVFFTHRQRLRVPTANEACNDLHLFTDSNTVLVAGHSEEARNVTVANGLLQEQQFQYGMLMNFNWNLYGDKSAETSGGMLLKKPDEVFPVALASSTNEDEGVYVLFLEANHDPDHINVLEGEQPHLGSEYFDYGSGYGLTVAKFNITAEDASSSSIQTSTATSTQISEMWSKHYEIASMEHTAKVSDMIYHPAGYLFVIGSTNDAADNTHGDLDGFVTKIDARTGGIVAPKDESTPTSRSIQSTKHGNDNVTGICYNPNDDRYVYLTGTTEGYLDNSQKHVKGTMSAFLLKLDLETLETIWVKQIGSETSSRHIEAIVHGKGCSVAPTGTYVWFGGEVDNGGVIVDSTSSTTTVDATLQGFGEKDIFVAKINIETGDTIFVEQFGSDQDDELAIRGGILSDAVGNAILVGNTHGSFYRERADDDNMDDTDVFVFTVSAFDGHVSNKIDSSIAISSTGSIIGKFLSIMFTLALIIIAIGGLGWLYQRYSHHLAACQHHRSATNRDAVTEYLDQFDIHDVELRNSATGGWHCTFVGKLASGINQKRRRQQHSQQQYNRPTSKFLSDEMYDEAISFDHSESNYSESDDIGGSTRSTTGLLQRVDPAFGTSNTESTTAPHTLYSDLVHSYNGGIDISERSSSSANDDHDVVWGKNIV